MCHITQAAAEAVGVGPVFRNINSSNQSFPDSFRVFRKLFTEEQCDEIIRQLENIPFKPSVVGTDKEAKSVSSIRRSKVKWIPMTPEYAWIYKAIEKAILQVSILFFI